MFERIAAMLVKEFIQVLRDPRMKGILFVMPIIQLMVFGYAVTTDVNHVRMAVYDLDQTVTSRDLTARFVESRYFDAVERVRNEAQLKDILDRGRAVLVLKFDRGFEGDVAAGRTAELQLLADGTDSNSVQIALTYANRIVAAFNRDAVERRIDRTEGAVRQPAQVTLQSRAWFNENLESRYYYVPGVMAMLVMLTALMLTSMAIVREREMGTMEQIVVTPMRRIEFILGKTVPFILIGFIDVAIVTVVAVLWFEVPIRGSMLVLFAGTGLFLMPMIGLGLIISAYSRTQLQAVMTTFFFNLPAIMLSGFMFPIANMPTVIQWLTVLNPMRYYLVIIRSVFLKGVGWDVLWTQMAALAILGVVSLAIAWRKFHKTVS